MSRSILILIVPLLLASCATLMNRPFTQTTIYTSAPAKIVIQQDTIETSANKAKVHLQRSNLPVTIVAFGDSTKKVLLVPATNAAAWYLNIPCNFGLGMLIDRDNPKRYGYPKRIYMDLSGADKPRYEDGVTNKKGEIYLRLSLPHVNNFLLHPNGESVKSNTGFFGLSVGADFYYRENKFINLQGFAVTDFLLPVPAPVDYFGAHESMRSQYIALSDNYRKNRFSFGYGISYAVNTWKLINSSDTTLQIPANSSLSISNRALGFIFSTYYQTGHRFNIGLIYRPTLINLHTEKSFNYEHLISLDLSWSIRVKK